MFETIAVLSSESVRRLKAEVSSGELEWFISQPLDQIVNRLSLKYVDTAYKINGSLSLEFPSGFSQDQNRDYENCLHILKILPTLTPADATDDRLWVTLSFGKFAKYLQCRWLSRNSGERLRQDVLNHCFATGIRGRIRDNGVSRLWWMGYIACQVSGLTPDEVFEVLFKNSDYRSSLLERNSTTNSIGVLSAILTITKMTGFEYDRDAFRSFMKHVNLLGGRRNLASMREADLVDLLTPLYVRAYHDCSKEVASG
jgi:hypothetical protein